LVINRKIYLLILLLILVPERNYVTKLRTKAMQHFSHFIFSSIQSWITVIASDKNLKIMMKQQDLLVEKSMARYS